MTSAVNASAPSAFFWIVTALLVVGLGLAWASAAEPARWCWLVATILGLIACCVWLAQAIRNRETVVDVVAILALVGTLLINEPLAGAVIAVMLASGRLLEARSNRRARRELSRLLARQPTTAKLLRAGVIEQVPAEEIRPGDVILVGTGEVIPVDGRAQTAGLLDESSLTGESAPVAVTTGAAVRSGTSNAGQPMHILATHTTSDSTYAGVVRLVEQAQASSSPMVRRADVIAWIFVPLTLLLAGGAWLVSGEPERAVAVLVVATPCPLILATPIAIMSGLSQAAQRGVVIKGGAVLERLARATVMLFDKTGTLTQGTPRVVATIVRDVADTSLTASEMLRLAASLDQVSPHVLAGAIVTAGAAAGDELTLPTAVHEEHGQGIEGDVTGRRVRLGRAEWLSGPDDQRWVAAVRHKALLDDCLTVFAAVDGRLAGVFLLADRIRPDAPRMLRQLRATGITTTVLLTGDRRENADEVAALVGIDHVEADCTPASKVAIVRRYDGLGHTIMVGDGINDAPALAAADVGIAMAARGATASSDAADVVLSVERLDAVAAAMRIARRAERIGLTAAVVGMGLAAVAMLAAAAGLLAPVAGAILQEAIDVLAILIALSTLLPSRAIALPALADADRVVLAELRQEHEQVRVLGEELEAVADGLYQPPVDLEPCRRLLRRLETELVPHEEADERRLNPLIAKASGGSDPTAALSRGHAEIARDVRRIHRLMDAMDPGAPDEADVAELRRLLHRLRAILELHNAQEEEVVLALDA